MINTALAAISLMRFIASLGSSEVKLHSSSIAELTVSKASTTPIRPKTTNHSIGLIFNKIAARMTKKPMQI